MFAVTAAIDVPLRGGIGSRAANPTSVAEIQSTYHVGIGQQTIDLSQVQFGGKTVHITASVGVGRLLVEVPPGVSVVAQALPALVIFRS